MPIYEYQCQACGERHEALQKVSEGALRKCPACGRLKLKRLVSAAAFHLKGTGWYVTDFRDKDKKKPSDKGEAEKPAAEAKGESKAESKAETKADTKTETATEAGKKKEGKGKDGGSAGASAG